MWHRKMLTLAGMALAVAALTAPSGATAKEFYADPANLTITELNQVTLDGSVSLTLAGGAFRIGPCATHGLGVVANVGGRGAGTFGNLTLGAPCSTNVPNCVLEESMPVSEEELPLTFPEVEEESEEEEVSLEETGFSAAFNDGCTALGIPPAVPITVKGKLTGKLTAEGCLTYNKAGDLKDAKGNPVTVDGEVCITDLIGGVPQGKGSITFK